jgi:hypothetical protein
MSQTHAILAHLERGHTITPVEALNKYGSFRLAARIAELREKGHPVQSAIVRRGDKRFARYWLAPR